MENRFSIIIPVYNKEEGIGRCLQSLISQTNGNFEAIIIDDGSTDGSREIIKSFMRRDKRISAYFLKENSGRLVARNLGMRMSRNDWICWLDADDIYVPTYLETYNDCINDNPLYKIFCSGMLILQRKLIGDKLSPDGYRIVPPLELSADGAGMEHFGGGRIGAGSFVFHRSLMWFFPEAKVPYGKDGSYPKALVRFDPIFEQICKQNDEGHWLPLGNPWGDDYSYIWYLTRKNKMKTINSILYIQYTRG